MSGDLPPPITGKSTTGLLAIHIHRRRVRNPKKAMAVSGTSNLPLITIPKILMFQQRANHKLHKRPPPEYHVMSDKVWLVLHPIPDEPTPLSITSPRHLGPTGKVPVKVLPLHVGSTKGYKDRRHVPREEAGLGVKVTTLIPPEWTRPRQSRTLPDDLGEEGIVSH
jgi:hypothetical protein